LPDTTLAGWREDVARALALKPNHLSLYALTLEPGVPLSRDRARYRFPDDDEVAAMYYAARDDITTAGFVHYEISNFARPGFECRHNLKYWRDEDWLGFGPSAAGHWRGQRYRNPAALAAYAAAAAAGRWPLGDAEPSDPYREMRTAFVLGLRLTAGVDVGVFTRRYGVDPLAYFEAELAELAAGLLDMGGGRVRLTREGFFLSDEVFARLI
jgi:oxygen-independent coproporphyrinogen-3 oxidase